MHNHLFSSLPALIPAAMLALPASAMAQVDTSEWKCEYCPFPDGYEADVEAGAANL